MKTNKLIFKVTTGYKPTDFVLIDNTADLEKAIYAKVEKIPVTLGGKFISGSEIKGIEPDVHSYTGWFRSYEPSVADDFAQIERDVPEIAYELIPAVTRRVEGLLANQQTGLIGKTALLPEELLNKTIKNAKAKI